MAAAKNVDQPRVLYRVPHHWSPQRVSLSHDVYVKLIKTIQSYCRVMHWLLYYSQKACSAGRYQVGGWCPPAHIQTDWEVQGDKRAPSTTPRCGKLRDNWQTLFADISKGHAKVGTSSDLWLSPNCCDGLLHLTATQCRSVRRPFL